MRTRTGLRIVAKILATIGLGTGMNTGLCAPAQEFPLEIGGGKLVDQLQKLEDLTKTQILFADETVDGIVQTKGVHGRYSTEAALVILLRDTGIVCVHVGDAFSLLPLDGRHPLERCLDVAPGPFADLPHLTTPPPQQPVAVVHVYTDRTGTHLEEGQQAGSEILTMNAREIRESGAHNLGDLLQTSENFSTVNFSGGATEDTPSGSVEALSNSGLAVAPNLRGVAARSTLTLLNGLPTAPSGSDASFGDLLGYPLAAIKQLDVLPDGASAIYGAAAVGGVVNIHTLEHYERPETHLEVGSVTNGHQEQHRFSQLGGIRWDSGDWLAVGEIYHRGALPAQARSQANAQGLSEESLFTSPGNLVAPDQTIYPISYNQSGRPLDFSTLSPGTPHRANPWLDADVLPTQTRWALYSSLHQSLNSSLSLWCDVLWSQRHAVQWWGGQEVLLHVQNGPLLLQAPQGGLTEMYSLLDDLGSRLTSVQIATLNATVGLQASLPGGWKLVFRGSLGRERESQLNGGQVDTGVLQASVDSGVFTPLGGGGMNNSTNVLSSVQTPQWYSSHSQLWNYQALLEGPFLSVGAGPWHEAIGIEFHDQGFRSADPALSNDLRRQIAAGFLEIEAPLLDANRFPALFRNLTLSLAGRYEHYSDFGQSAAVPRIGIEWAPLDHLTLKGTWGWSIRAPLLGDVSEAGNTAVLDTTHNVLIRSGGNSQLRVERALTRTLGMLLHREDADTQVSGRIGYFDLRYYDRIDQLQPESDIFTDPQYASYVTDDPDRAAVAKVCNNSTYSQGTRQDCLQQQVSAIVDLRLHNLYTLRTNGIDARIKGSVDSPYGKWGASITGTYVLEYAQTEAPGGALISTLNIAGYPLALHLVPAASWQLGPLKATLTLHHAGRYRDTQAIPITRVGSWTTTDARLAYTFGDPDEPGSHPIEVAGSCQNLFNRMPPLALLDNRGYDGSNGDLTGRSCTASVHMVW